MVSALLMAAVLTNSGWMMRCPLSAAAEDHSGLPDCCKDGMCPHHAAEHRQCLCDLFSDTAASMQIASMMPATLFAPVAIPVILSPVGPVREAILIQPLQPILIPSTPPPKA
jgi:hypothetical protein